VNSMQAYVLVQTHSDAGRIAGDLRAVPGVVLAEDLSGPYDAIALVHSDSSSRPLEGVIAGIREVPGVTRAVSAPLLHSSKDLGDGEAA
jgi:hypothetical protein